jgi:hypothetical protein
MTSNSAADHLYIGSQKVRLPAAAESLHQQFQQAQPFPHIVLDDLFPDELLDGLNPELPDVSDRRHWAFENSATLTRYNIRSPVELGTAGQQLIAFLHSAHFLYFLTELTGIANLLPDPYLRGGGYNKMPRAGFFQVHSDRNTAYDAGLMRRLALIIYLNKDWPHEYGGQLELWRPGANTREVSVEPVFNRTIIFDTGEGHLHGVPTVCCPENRTRNSFLAYYHTVGVDGKKDIPGHGTLYAPSFYGPPKLTPQAVLKDWTPPFIYRALRRLVRSG